MGVAGLLEGKALPSLEPAKLAALATKLCDRHFGVGADGLIVAAHAQKPGAALDFLYFNADGSRAEMCGNGIRCYALFALDKGYVVEREFTVSTLAGPIRPRVNADRSVTVDMGPPVQEPARVPFIAQDAYAPGPSPSQLRLDDGRTLRLWPVGMGNPHCIVFQDLQDAPLDPAVDGPMLEKHPAFPAKTNVEFVRQVDATTFDVVVWERGCGFTLACGTGACATTVAARLAGKLQGIRATVRLPAGRWPSSGRATHRPRCR